MRLVEHWLQPATGPQRLAQVLKCGADVLILLYSGVTPRRTMWGTGLPLLF